MNSAAAPISEQPIRIVVADHDPRIRHAFIALIALLDYPINVEQAGNKNELLERDAAFDPAIVILDLALFGDGEDLAQLRALRLAHRSVVAVSHLESRRSQALLAGAVAFIEKGSTPDVVLQSLDQTIAFHRNSPKLNPDSGVA